jgi:hypothetical protein
MKFKYELKLRARGSEPENVLILPFRPGILLG